MITRECEHTLPFMGGATATVSAPAYACIFCHINELTAALSKSEGLLKEAEAKYAADRAKTLGLVLEHDAVVQERDRLEYRLTLQHVKCMHCSKDFGEHERGYDVPEVREHVVSCAEHPLAKQRDSAITECDSLREENAKLMAIVGQGMEEMERMRAVYEAAVTIRPIDLAMPANGDWACVQCRPHSDMLKEGFRCRQHTLLNAIDAATTKPEAGK